MPMMTSSMMHNNYLGVLLACCLIMHTYCQRFSQEFIDAINNHKQKNISHEKTGVNLYRMSSQVLTGVALVYATYNLFMLYTATHQTKGLSSYIMPAWISSCNNGCRFMISSMGIVIKTYCYKTLAQVLLAVAMCSMKENIDYIFSNKYEDD